MDMKSTKRSPYESVHRIISMVDTALDQDTKSMKSISNTVVSQVTHCEQYRYVESVEGRKQHWRKCPHRIEHRNII